MADTTSYKFFTMGDSNVGALLASTTNFWLQNKVEDNIFNTTPFLSALKKNSKTASGGSSIVVPIMYEVNSTSQWYSKYDSLEVTPQEGMTLAQALWKSLATSISISGEEEAMNSGNERMLSLLQAKMDQAELSMKRQLTTSLFAAATASKAIQCMPTMVDATSTIEDINSTSNSWWQSTNTTSGSFAAQGLSDMRTLHSTLGTRTPENAVDMIVTTPTVLDYYEASLTPMTRYTNDNRNLEGSVETLRFRTATVFSDTNCNSGVMYMFPSKNLYLVLLGNSDMKKTEFVKPANQDCRTAQIIIRCNLVTNARRKLGKLNTISA